jgi:hypothetical protein
MGFWDGAADSFKSGLMLKGPNYVKKQRAKLEGLMVVAVRRAYQNNRASAAQVGRNVQYRDGDLEVLVKVGYNADHDCYVTDIIVKPLGHGHHGSHQHVIIDERGNEIMNEWRKK